MNSQLRASSSACRLLVSTPLALALLLGCDTQSAPRHVDDLAESQDGDGYAASISEGEPATADGREESEAPTTTRKLIRNARVELEVDSAEQAVTEIRGLVEAAGGYVGDESRSEDGYGAQHASMTCRVPADALDDLLAEVEGKGRVESLRVNAEDITARYFDLEIRLATERQLESRLVALLDRASNDLEDLLDIEKELARVRGEIDQMEGRQRFWDHQVALATLVVALSEPRPAIAGNRGGTLRTLGRAFRDAGNNFVDALAFLIASSGALVPLFVVLIGFVWLIRKLLRRGKKPAEKGKEAS